MDVVTWLLDWHNLVSPWFWLGWIGGGLIAITVVSVLSEDTVFLYFTLSGIFWVTFAPIVGGLFSDSWLFFVFHTVACLLYVGLFFAAAIFCERFGRSSRGDGGLAALAPITLFAPTLILGMVIMAVRQVILWII